MQASKASFTRLDSAAMVLFAMVFVLILTTWLVSETQSGIRVYVRAEGTWGKNHRIAMDQLDQYIMTAQPQYLSYMHKHFQACLEFKNAREALDKQDWAAARQFLIAGGVHPEDVFSVLLIYRYMNWIPAVQDALSIWADANTSVDRLYQEVRSLALSAGDLPPEAGVIQQRQLLDSSVQKLVVLEDRFDNVLGTLARSISSYLFWTTSLLYALAGIATYLLLRTFTRRHLEHELIYAAIFRHAGDGIAQVGVDRALLKVNQPLARMLGYDPLALIGTKFDALLHPEERAQHQTSLENLIFSPTSDRLELEARLVTHQGATLWTHCNYSVIRDQSGNALYMIVMVHDSTQSHEIRRKLSETIRTDHLTGLINREEFQHQVEQVIEAGDQAAILYLDLDKFKLINDTCGHSHGDTALQQIAECIAGLLPEDAELARVGGDEFAVLLRTTSIDGATRVAKTIRNNLAAYRLQVAGMWFSTGVSIGIAPVTPGESEFEYTLMAADAACYRAKQGKGISVYRQTHHGPNVQQLSGGRATLLREAIDNDRLHIYQNPIAGPGDTMVIREFMAQIPNQSGKAVAISRFRSAAHRYALVDQMDAWLLRHFIRVIAQEKPVFPGKTMIGLSSASVVSGSLVHDLTKLLDEFQVHGNQVCVQLSHQAAVQYPKAFADTLEQLDSLQVVVALRKVSGSLSTLDQIDSGHVQYVQIDQELVAKHLTNPAAKEVMNAIQRLAKLWGIKTIAQGVDSDALKRSVIALGVDYYQGLVVGDSCLLPLRSAWVVQS